MFDDPKPKDTVVNSCGDECTVEEFNNMSDKEKKEWVNHLRRDVPKFSKEKDNPA